MHQEVIAEKRAPVGYAVERWFGPECFTQAPNRDGHWVMVARYDTRAEAAADAERNNRRTTHDYRVVEVGA